jgi:pSer/pThr/pTyr-binding forkhead associated (FHA) protein
LPSTRYALRFISGKYQGGEFPLRLEREFVIGRSTDVDMILVEDMVSRRHARILPVDGLFEIEDLDSTNGTFVNGEKIKRTRLKEGDRILIGTSILRLIAAEGSGPSETASEVRKRLEQSAARRATNVNMRMTGVIQEIPLPDLMQLLSTSRKSGVLVIHSEANRGQIYFRKGQIYHAVIEDAPEVRAHKAICRMLAWETGTFVLEPPDDKELAEELSESTEGLLIEGMRQLDEVRRILPRLPPRQSLLSVPTPLSPPLRDLKPAELDVVQLVLNSGGKLQTVLDKSPQSDIEVLTAVLSLLEREYLVSSR